MNNEPYDFGLRLKGLRLRKDLTQEQLAELVGVKKQSINKYEANVQSPTVRTLRKFALIFGTSADYLLGLTDDSYLHLNELTKADEQLLLTIVNLMVERMKQENE